MSERVDERVARERAAGARGTGERGPGHGGAGRSLPAADDRLIGWKSIAAYLGCDARTAKRWESARSLPVHRVPGDGMPTVWADRSELRHWLRGVPDAVVPPPVVVPPVPTALPAPGPEVPATGAAPLLRPVPPRRPMPRWRRRALAALGVTGVLAGGAGTLWGNRPAPAAAPLVAAAGGPYDDDAAARARYLNARFALGTRSAAGIAAAARDFQALTLRFPDRAAGYSGLADAYVLSREFGAVPDAIAFPKAAQAAHTALALDPRLTDARLNQAYIAFWWNRDHAAGLAGFAEAVRQAPEMAKAHHWYATALLTAGDFRTARAELAHARALDPNNHAIVADAAFVELSAGNYAVALPALEALAQLDPGFAAAHRYLALGYLVTGRDADYLREAAETARLMGRDRQAAAVVRAAAAFQRGGRAAMLGQLIRDAVAAEARGEGCINDIIGLHALAGDRAGMLRWLAVERARPRNDSATLIFEPMMIAVRRDPALLAETPAG